VSKDGSTVCRYHGNKDSIIDVIVHKDGSWDIEAYSNSHELLRKIKAADVRNSIPGMVELRAWGFRKYSLRLKLISAEAVSPGVNHSRPAESPHDDE